jgi:ATP-dependent Lon protease
MKILKNVFPLIPLRDILVFPGTNTTFKVGRDVSRKAVDAVMKTENREVILVLQKDMAQEDAAPENIHNVGTICSLIQIVEAPGNLYHVFLEGRKRVKIKKASWSKDGYIETEISSFVTTNKKSPEIPKLRKVIDASVSDLFYGRRMPSDFLENILSIKEDEKFLDLITAGFFEMDPIEAQKILETADLKERFEKTASFIKLQMELKDLEDSIESNVKERFEKQQKEYFINEQINALRSQLTGHDHEDDSLKEKIEQLDAPEYVLEKIGEEFRRYMTLPPMSSESAVVRTYIDTLISIPWENCEAGEIDISRSKDILEKDHFGLEDVKERILEYLAVLKLKGDLKAPIICLVGPPGVGKTSVAASVARAVGRKFIRVSLGGIKDEAEIRGHRRTYVGAMPGKIMHYMIRSGVKDPLFLLDEIDKLGNDYKGDPASALLEVLDPEQNNSFVDHYVDLEFDLSRVLFIATANDKSMIPPALRDRMEIIDIEGYTWYEKKNIASTYLIPKQKENNGIEHLTLSFTKNGMNTLIDSYTSESGVRELERKIGSICRKIALNKVAETGKTSDRYVISERNIADYLGPEKYSEETKAKDSGIGLVNGLAWTPYGGSVLQMEALRYPGKGDVKTTGSLGEIMKESVEIAVSYVKSIAEKMFGLDGDDWGKYTIHVHFPEGAVPKDGPSAGIAIAVAVASVMSEVAVKPGIGMTGELTLRGKILKIGGLQAKLMAAKKAGIKKVFIPESNRQDLVKIPEEVKKGMLIVPVKTAESVIEECLNLSSGKKRPGKRK